MTRKHTTTASATRTGESIWTADGQFSQSQQSPTGSLDAGVTLANIDEQIPTRNGPNGETVYELPRRGTTTSAEIAEAAWAEVDDV